MRRKAREEARALAEDDETTDQDDDVDPTPTEFDEDSGGALQVESDSGEESGGVHCVDTGVQTVPLCTTDVSAQTDSSAYCSDIGTQTDLSLDMVSLQTWNHYWSLIVIQ